MNDSPWAEWQDFALRHPLAGYPQAGHTHDIPINDGELDAVVILAVDR